MENQPKGLSVRALSVKKNALLRMWAVQSLYQKHKQEGIPDAFIWRTYVYPAHLISLDTFYRHLQTNVRKEMKAVGLDPDLLIPN